MNFVSPKPEARGYHALGADVAISRSRRSVMEVFVPLHRKCSGLDFVWCPAAQPHLTCVVTLPVAGQRVPK